MVSQAQILKQCSEFLFHYVYLHSILYGSEHHSFSEKRDCTQPILAVLRLILHRRTIILTLSVTVAIPITDSLSSS